MNIISYYIDGDKIEVTVDESPEFSFGKEEVLSQEATDLTFYQSWYTDGYSEVNFLSEKEFEQLKKGIESSLEKIIRQEFHMSTEGFTLENYHKYVSNEVHFKVVSKTRDLFENDFVFPIKELHNRLESVLECQLTDTVPGSEEKIHIIVRINRPNTKDFNPPHKDVYEAVDEYNFTPKMVNFWIPIAGVTKNSSLPIAPKSHLISEDKILRTFKGGVVEGNTYRVRTVQSWDGSNSLIRSNVRYGDVLIFSSYLIHGLAINTEPDVTRVSLEFRLFKK